MFSIVIDKHTSKKAYTLKEALTYAEKENKDLIRIHRTNNEQSYYFNIRLLNHKDIVNESDLVKLGIKNHDVKNYHIFFIIKDDSNINYEQIYNLRNLTFNKCMCLNKEKHVLMFLPKLSDSYYYHWLSFIKMTGVKSVSIYLLTNIDYLNQDYIINTSFNYSMILKNIDRLSDNHSIEVPIYDKEEIKKLIIDSEKLQDKSSVEFHYKNKSIFILKKDKKYENQFKDYDYVIFFDKLAINKKIESLYNNLNHYKIDYFKIESERYIYIGLKNIQILQLIEVCLYIQDTMYLPLGIKMFTIQKEIVEVKNKQPIITDKDYIVLIQNDYSEDFNISLLQDLNKNIKSLNNEYFQIAFEYQIVIGVKKDNLNFILNELTINLKEESEISYKEVNQIDNVKLSSYKNIYNNQKQLLEITS